MLPTGGCGSSASSGRPDAAGGDSRAKPTADAGAPHDARPRDASVHEAGATDGSAAAETGVADTGRDGRSAPPDARPDANESDAAIPGGDASSRDGSLDAGPVLPTLPAAVIAAGCTQNVFFDDFDDLHTVDMQDTRAPGFNWYRYNASSGTSTPASSLSTVEDGAVSALRFSTAGGGLSGATRSTQYGPVGRSFSAMGGKCTYIEGRVAMGLVPTTATVWPAFWALATKHMQNVLMPWEGDSNTDYEHYIEIDIMELATRYSYNARSTLIDWYGDYSTATTDCAMTHYCKTQDSQGLGPNVAGTYDSTEAAPVFHRYSALWIPSVAQTGQATYSQGAMHWYIDGAEMGTAPTWVGPTSTTTFVPTTPWTYGIIDEVDVSLIMDTGAGAFMDLDYAAVWQTP